MTFRIVSVIIVAGSIFVGYMLWGGGAGEQSRSATTQVNGRLIVE